MEEWMLGFPHPHSLSYTSLHSHPYLFLIILHPNTSNTLSSIPNSPPPSPTHHLASLSRRTSSWQYCTNSVHQRISDMATGLKLIWGIPHPIFQRLNTQASSLFKSMFIYKYRFLPLDSNTDMWYMRINALRPVCNMPSYSWIRKLYCNIGEPHIFF